MDRAVLVPGQGLMERLDRELTAARPGGAGEVLSEKNKERIREVERGGQAERGEGRVDTEEEGKEEGDEVGGEGGRSREAGGGAIGWEWSGEARGSLEPI